MEEAVLSLDCLRLAEKAIAYESQVEDELDTDIEDDEHTSIKKGMSTAEVYLQVCKLVGVVPVSFYVRNLGCATINLNHHGLGPLGGKALAIALVTDTHTTSLELADNFLLAEGARYLMQMLKANFTIQNLDLSDNHLQSEGAEYISKTLLDNVTIKSIKLSVLVQYCQGHLQNPSSTMMKLALMKTIPGDQDQILPLLQRRRSFRVRSLKNHQLTNSTSD